MIRSIGFIGGGDFGNFFAERVRDIEPGIDTRVWDKFKPSTHSREDTAQSDVVVFTVRPKAYESSMREIIPLMRRDAIIGDVCGVKMHTIKLLHELSDGRGFFGTHPMFGRGSYRDNGNSIRGLQVAVCEYKLPSNVVIELEHLLMGRLGLELVQLTPEQHDRITAQEQLLPQYIGRIVKKAGFARSVSGAHTTASRHFYTAMEIVAPDEELFHEMCELNPFWAEIEAQYEIAAAEYRYEAVKRRNGRT